MTQLTKSQACKLITALQHWSLKEMIRDDMVDAVYTLHQIAYVENDQADELSDTYSVYLTFVEGERVSGIKAIRTVTGLGLKEAKDLYDKFNPHHNAIRCGPVATNLTQHQAHMLYRTISNENTGVVLDVQKELS